MNHQDGSFEYPQHMLWLRNKIIIFLLHTLTITLKSLTDMPQIVLIQISLLLKEQTDQDYIFFYTFYSSVRLMNKFNIQDNFEYMIIRRW